MLDYISILSAVIKIAYIMVLYHIYSEYQAEVCTIIEEKGIREADIRQFGISMFIYIR